MNKEDGSLDGVYLQFQDKMLTKNGAQKMRELADTYTVGVWEKVGKDPDNLETFRHLVTECGVSFVNSALPRKFLRGGTAAATATPSRHDETQSTGIFLHN